MFKYSIKAILTSDTNAIRVTETIHLYEDESGNPTFRVYNITCQDVN